METGITGPPCPSLLHTGLVPLGALGSVEFTLATLPLISNQYIELDINVSGGVHGWGAGWRPGRGAPETHHTLPLLPLQPIVKSVAGDIIDFPKPRLPVKVPPKDDHTSQVTVPLYLFSTVFGLLQSHGVLDIDITTELVSGSSEGRGRRIGGPYLPKAVLALTAAVLLVSLAGGGWFGVVDTCAGCWMALHVVKLEWDPGVLPRTGS